MKKILLKLLSGGITFEMESGKWELNPILHKGLRTQLRKRQFFLFQTLYALILGIFFLFLYHTVEPSTRQQSSSGFGNAFFWVIFGVQMFLIYFIAPGATTAAFAREKEKGSFESLLLTSMAPRDLFVGKLFSSISPILLFVFSSFPIIALSIFWGGISPLLIFGGLILLFLVAIINGVIGLAYSIILSTENKAKLATYATLLFPGIGYLLPIAGIILWALSYNKLKNYNGLRRRKFRHPTRRRQRRLAKGKIENHEEIPA